jgi:DNA (cytosine-5)-methyltransferase 1
VSKPRLLDLFCGAGGAAVGYARAGFEVVGVDLKPQPHYPFEFHQMDALSFPFKTGDFDAIHASPPCQAHSALRSLWKDAGHLNLIPATRAILIASGLDYVIENVPGAPLLDPFTLCGSMFGLGSNGRQLRRHRLFETNWFAGLVPPCTHSGQPVGVYGHGGGGKMTRGYKGTAPEYREAMGIKWASKAEIAQAIPPAYTEWIGTQLLKHWRGSLRAIYGRSDNE